MNVKQGYGKVESGGVFVKWKRRWLVLKESADPPEKVLLLFKNEKESRNSAKLKIALQDVQNIEVLHSSENKNIIRLNLKKEGSQKFSFDSDSELNEWYEQLNVICFGSVLGKSFEKMKENDEQKKSETVDSTENANDIVKRELYSVYLQPSAKLNISGECNLEVTSEEILVFDAKCPSVKLVSWPIPSLRRFGSDATRFTFEAGRRCDTGEGIFVFKTKDGKMIHQIVQSYAHRLAYDTKNLPSVDDSESEKFVFRELPPVPKE